MDQIDTREAERVREQYGWWRGVHVTDATMTVGDLTYEVALLRRLRVARGRPPAVRRAVFGVAVTQAAVVAMALAALVQMNGATEVIYLVGAGQGILTAVLVGTALLRWPRPLELWARYRGRLIMLYRDADRYEFGKVRRALLRAMLSHRLHA